MKAALNDRWIQLRSSSYLRPQPILGLKRSRPLQIKALKLFKVHWTEELENFQKISSYWNCKLKVPKITFKVKQKALEDFPKVSRGKVCAVCHWLGHNRAKCTQMPCNDVNVCKIKEKHPSIGRNSHFTT